MTNKKNSVTSKKVAGAPARNRHFELAPILAPSLDSTMETYEAYLLCYRLYRESVEQFRKQQVEGKSKGAEASQAHRSGDQNFLHKLPTRPAQRPLEPNHNRDQSQLSAS